MQISLSVSVCDYNKLLEKEKNAQDTWHRIRKKPQNTTLTLFLLSQPMNWVGQFYHPW